MQAQPIVMADLIKKKENQLFVLLGGFFMANAMIAEFIGVKIFALEDSLGWDSFNWSLFGQEGSLSFTAGVILWPVVFIMTDIINEYFGKRGVKFLSYLTIGLISYAFVMVYLAMSLAPAQWWIGMMSESGVPDMQKAFEAIFGQGLWIIAGSLIAFLIGQILDVTIYQRIRSHTGEKMVWLRATGSTLFSQFVDSFVVLYIAFVLGPQQWPLALMLAVGTVNYAYKFIVAIALTPVIYAAHSMIDKFLGEKLASKLKKEASKG